LPATTVRGGVMSYVTVGQENSSPDGPHAIIWTHAAEVNRALLGFLRAL